MGHYAKKLHRKLALHADGLPTEEPKRRPGELLPGGVKDIPTLIKEDGGEPEEVLHVHARAGANRRRYPC